MATRGRPPKPIAQLKLLGTDRKDRHAKRSVEPTSGKSVNKPDALAEDAEKFWNAVVPKFEAMGILDGVDESQLEGLATAWANWKSEQRKLDAGDGHIYRVSCAWSMFDRIASKFAMNPVDRTKLAIGDGENESDPLVEMLRARANQG